MSVMIGGDMMDVTCDTRGFGGRNPVLLHHLVNAARGGVPLQCFDMRRVLKKVFFAFRFRAFSTTQSAEHRGLHDYYGNAVLMSIKM